MSRGILLILLALFSLLGVVDSWYLAESAMTDTSLICDIDGLDGCNVVAQSPYAQFLGVPLGVYGVGFYTLAFIGVFVLVYAPRRLYYLLYLAFSIVGALLSLVFLGIQLFLIQATCIYCLASALLTFLMVAVAYPLYKRFAPQVPAVIP